MSSRVVYISDFFLDDILGGAELNDYELCNLISDSGYSLQKIRSHEVTIPVLDSIHGSRLIISNFINLRQEVKDKIIKDFKYILYEHDHKYLKSRNPARYKDFVAPAENIINFEFYKNAAAIFCQSLFHNNIVQNNLGLKNIINLSGNLWSLESLDLLTKLNKKNKIDQYSVLKSNIPHKNTKKTIFFCQQKGFKYELISSPSYKEFLSMLANNKKFIFLPETPETLSRVVVEARMLGAELLVNKNVGAHYESWIKLRGDDLIAFMKDKRAEISNLVLEELND